MEFNCTRGSVVEIYKELDIPTSILSRWHIESGAYGKNGFFGKGNPKLTDGQCEIPELKKRLGDAELERDILTKAIAIFF